jgi:hypothetical protein
MEILEVALTNGDQITFSVLFIAMLLYVIKTNDAREQNYRDTIKELTTALNGFEDLKNAVADIKTHIYNK